MTPPNWFRVYSHRGERLIVRALDSADAKDRARLRWQARGLYVANLEARPATESEVAEHLTSVAAMERLGQG